MMPHLLDLIRAHAGGMDNVPPAYTYGHLVQYDPKTNTGTFSLQLYADDSTGQAIETGFIPIGTPFTGVNYGMQFQIEEGMQALVVFLAEHVPVCAFFTFNQEEIPPFTDGSTNGWKDKTGNLVTTDTDGVARVQGTVKTELGGIGMGTDQEVVRRKDIAPLVILINDLIAKFNAHTHTANNTTIIVPEQESDAAVLASSTTVFSQD